ncbi:MAG: quinone oxidoreductase [Rhizobiaceae bacterium]
MPKAIRIHAHGGPEVLTFEEYDPGAPKAGEARIRQTAIGVNFLDCYYRMGTYPPPNGLPLVVGSEAAGEVIALGEGVTSLKVGDRVAYTIGTGAYAEERVIAADRLVKIPDGISDEQAAAMMLKGMTVEYLLRRTYKVQPGDTVLFHAAAGGVGLIFGEWARHLGATVIGTAGGPEKVALAKEHGFDYVIDYRSQDFVAEVREITGGRMCNVVYDSIGKDTFPASLDCLRPLGMFVSFGQASGVIPAFDMNLLARKGALFATRPTLFTYIAARSDLEASAAAMFAVLQSGAVKVVINQRSKLSDAAKVHTDLEARRTTGTSLLIP